MSQKSIALRCAIAALTAWVATSAVADEAARSYRIAQQPLDQALREFALTSNIDLLFSPDLVSGKYSPILDGKFTVDEGLRVLLHGSGLAFSVNGAQVVIAKEKAQTQRTTSSITTPSSLIRVAHTAELATEESSNADGKGDDGTARRVQLEEVIVTGSHIRGAQNLSSPVLRYEREEIERSGYSTTQEFIQSLPQNLATVSDSTFSSLNGGAASFQAYLGSGVDLRGLGASATLTLLNGRRLTASGDGSSVDISLIPLSAVERVEILSDGASALYGSDAVGGVVNMILRKDFTGAETRVRYGTVTQGSHDEVHAGQTLGHSWGSGQALVSYEYMRRTQLNGSDREFFEPISLYSNPSLIPPQTRQGALAMLSQRFGDRFELSADFFYGKRESDLLSQFGLSALTYDTNIKVRQYGGAMTLSADLSDEWQVRISGAMDRNESFGHSVMFGVFEDTFENESALDSLEVVADGPLMNAPGGKVRLALGGQLRDERFEDIYYLYPARLDREVTAAYAEVLVPWVTQANRRAGVERLELSFAGRYESYSDFGSAFNPKVGLAWAPHAALTVRGTWGTSFKAPLLSQLNPNNVRVGMLEEWLRDASGQLVTGINVVGSGERLGPEESRNWTIGLDFSPAAIKGLNVSTTYFDIDYTDRIKYPFPDGYDPVGVLLDPAYDLVVTRDPSAAEVAALMARPNASCFNYVTFEDCTANLPPAEEVAAIVNSRLRNLAAVRMKGIDLSTTYGYKTEVGDWNFQLSGQYLLHNREQLIAGVPAISTMNDVWRPVDLRLRAGASFVRGPVNAAAYVNYTDDYRDSRAASAAGGSVQRTDVASWTTVDLTLQYKLFSAAAKGWLGETTLGLSVVNLFDRDPPYVANSFGLFFDGVNANPRGRFVSAQLAARW